MAKSPHVKVYGIFGTPLTHTLSPAMHNSAFKKLKLRCFYLPIEVRPAEFQVLLGFLKKIPIAGFNVTIPYKKDVAAICDRLSPEARAIGAVNTVKRVGNRLVGYNTDAEGFLRALKEEAKWSPLGKNVLLLGAGGAGHACAWALGSKRAKTVWIANIILADAKSLARRMGKLFPKTRFVAMGIAPRDLKAILQRADALIQATSVGLKRTDPSLVPASCWPSFAKATEGGPKRELVVMDLVYNPPETQLLKLAKKRGCRTLNGLSMLLYQGAKAFEIWTGRRAPVDVMRRALVKGLQG